MPGKLRHRTLTRRTFIKASAATGAALATGPVFAPAVHAQAKPIKIGYVSPATGPLAPFAAADEFMLQQFREATKGGLKVGNTTRPIEVLLRDSQSNPNRAAEVAKELIVRDKIDLMLVGNTPENLRAWILDPQRIKPGVLMPGYLDLSEEDLAALVEYLEGLE